MDKYQGVVISYIDGTQDIFQDATGWQTHSDDGVIEIKKEFTKDESKFYDTLAFAMIPQVKSIAFMINEKQD